jgi:hypothetical protein
MTISYYLTLRKGKYDERKTHRIVECSDVVCV